MHYALKLTIPEWSATKRMADEIEAGDTEEFGFDLNEGCTFRYKLLACFSLCDSSSHVRSNYCLRPALKPSTASAKGQLSRAAPRADRQLVYCGGVPWSPIKIT
jgi:hypothetical protein